MRRLALLALLALAHLLATIFFLWLNLWLLFRALNSHPAPRTRRGGRRRLTRRGAPPPPGRRPSPCCRGTAGRYRPRS
jgi:hypothetical protein